MGEDPLTDFTRGWDTVDLGDKMLYAYPFSIIENSSFPFGYVEITPMLFNGLFTDLSGEPVWYVATDGSTEKSTRLISI